MTPFGFAFGTRDQVFVTEAFGGAENVSAISSYEIGRGRHAHPDQRVGHDRPDGGVLGRGHAGRPLRVSSRTPAAGRSPATRIDFDGTIELLDDDGRTGVTGDGSTPIDVVITDSGRYLYNLNSGTHTISAFRIQSDGSLTRLPFTGGLPVGANGLAAR